MESEFQNCSRELEVKSDEEVKRLKEIRDLQNEIKELEEKLQEKKDKLYVRQYPHRLSCHLDSCTDMNIDDIARYSRQIILPTVGLEGQKKLRNASVLIVGAGGLGCPVAMYLCAAGIGLIGLIDDDEVESSNLPRQILHEEASVKASKVHSAGASLRRLNSKVKTREHLIRLSGTNALQIVLKYHVIVDASDNVITRYVLNDACVKAKRPLICGSALQLDGQLSVYNYNNGPCYRCIFPRPPPPDAIGSCSTSGILGPVCGVIGSLQALQAINIIVGQTDGVLTQRMLIFDGSDVNFRIVKLREKSPGCITCGQKQKSPEMDEKYFYGCSMSDTILNEKVTNPDRLNVQDLRDLLNAESPLYLIDIRTKVEYDMCHIPEADNVPFEELFDESSTNHVVEELKKICQKYCNQPSLPVIFICNRGSDSQVAAVNMKRQLDAYTSSVLDVEGGLHAWSESIDPNFVVL